MSQPQRNSSSGRGSRQGDRSRGRSGSGPGRGRRSGGSARRSGTSQEVEGDLDPLKPTLDPPKIDHFREFDLGDDIQASIAGMGIEVPTPVQKLAIGPVLEGRDVIAKAETGTGKTLAFGAPMMARIDADRSSVLGLVLCPTRELAQQVENVLKVLGEARGVTTALVVGGEPMHPQVNALKAGAQVVVGTPGRVIDLMNQGFLQFPWTEYAVLDEADEMLEIGFLPDVKLIFERLPQERQTLLFSATFPPALLSLARSATNNPAEIATAKGVATVNNITQCWVPCDDRDRARTLISMLDQSDKDDVFLVFCERRTEVDRLLRTLERTRHSIKALHGGYDQAARFRVMSAFRERTVKALVATDVASRGLDVAHVTHVVNYSVPREISDYTHRIGRTGRAGRSGEAITFVTHEQSIRWREISKQATWDIPQHEPRGKQRDSHGSDRDADRGRGSDSRDGRSRTSERSGERSNERSGERSDNRGGRDRGRDRNADRDDRGSRSSSSSSRHRPAERASSNERRGRIQRPDSEVFGEQDGRGRSERNRDGARSERPNRDRNERSERPARDRNERPERPARDRNERSERPARGERERDNRSQRSDNQEPRRDRDRDQDRESRSSEREDRNSQQRPERRPRRRNGSGNRDENRSDEDRQVREPRESRSSSRNSESKPPQRRRRASQQKAPGADEHPSASRWKRIRDQDGSRQ